MYDILQSSTQSALLFFMVQSSDHITGLTGASPTVTLSKNGAAFASPSGSVSEISSGWYKVAGNATDTATLGPLALHATAASGDPCDMLIANIVAYNPQTTSLGLSLAKTTNITGFNDIAAPTGFAAATFPSGTIANTTNITAGIITTVTNLTNAPTAGDFTTTMKTSLNAATITLSSPQTWDLTGNITGNLSGSVGSVTGLTASDVGAIKTQTDKMAFTVSNQIDANIKSVAGTTVTGNGSAGTPWGP